MFVWFTGLLHYLNWCSLFYANRKYVAPIVIVQFFYVFIRNISCHTLCFCLIFFARVGSKLFLCYVYKDKSNHWTPPIFRFGFFFVFIFYTFCFYFLILFIFSYYLFDEHMTSYDCYLSIKIPCYMNKYTICSTFMMAFVTYLDFELLDNGWYSHSISCCNGEVLLRWKIFKQIFYIYSSIWCHIEKPV